MKFTFLFLVGLLLLNNMQLNACLVASQERLIPIGLQDDCVLAIKVFAQRYDSRESHDALWDYTFELVGFNDDYTDYPVAQTQTFKAIVEEEREVLLKKQIENAIENCKSINNFTPFQIESISFCDYQTTCSDVKLELQKNGLTAVTNKKHNQKNTIAFLQPNYNGEIAWRIKEDFAFFEVTDTALANILKISSVRKYKSPKGNLLVFHLGTGYEPQPADPSMIEPKIEKPFKGKLQNLTHTNFIEPLLHHGKGFDYFIFVSNHI